jgi:hypothetical protein
MCNAAYAMNTALEKLKQKYADKIKQREAELEALHAKLNVIEEVDAEARHLELGLGSNTYAGKGLTQAIEEAIKAIGQEGVSARALTKHLRENGFKSASQNVAVSVHTTLRRLLEKGRIDSIEEEGKIKLYRPIKR